MAREKIKRELIPIENLEGVDGALLEIAKLQIGIDEINLDAERQIQAIREKAQAKAREMTERLQILGESIFAYTELNKTKILDEGKKTIELQFGYIGYRKSTRVSISKSTLELLKQMGFNEAIRIKEEVNKEVMMDWDDGKLSAVKAKKISEDTFWYETKKEKVIEILQKKVEKVTA